MLESGIPVLNSFEILSTYIKDNNLCRIIRKIKINLEKGNSIAESFEETRVFSKFIIIMLKIGEESGNLDNVTKILHVHFEEKSKLNRKIFNSLIYPVFVLVTTFIASLILMFNIVPLFEEVFSSINNSMPSETMFILELSHILRENYLLIPIICFIFITLTMLILKNSKGFQIVKYIPIASKINHDFNCYIFTRSLYLLSSSGISLNSSINILQDIISEKSFKEKLKRIGNKVNQGYEFNVAMKEEKLFDNYSLSLIAVGEESGTFDKVLLHISEKLLEKVKNKLKVITYMISPISLIFVGVVTFVILSSLIVPLYENMNLIG